MLPNGFTEGKQKKGTELQLNKAGGNLEEQNFATQVQFLPADHS